MAVILPDGAKFEMAWKHVKYMNHGNYIIFQIVPMISGKDLVLIPNMKNWKKIISIFPIDERQEIIFLLERLNWKRDIRVIELDISAQIDRENEINTGSLESTEAYISLTKENLFDNNSILGKEQVKSIYLTLEKRFSENLQGTVNISKDLLINNSVMKEFIIPILEGNKNINLIIS